MVGWIILGVILAILVAILLLPVGVDLGYENGILHVSAKVSRFLVQIIPRPKKKPKKPKKEKAKKPKPEQPAEEKPKEKKEKRKLDFTKEELFELAQTVLKGLGRFRRKLKVDRFLLHYTAAGWDPYNTAMTFGYVNAALSSLAPVCAQRFTVKDCDVWTDVDFCDDWMHLDIGLAMTIRIGQILGVGIFLAFGALKILLRSKGRQKREAKQLAAEAANAIEPLKEIENINSQEEERKAANG